MLRMVRAAPAIYRLVFIAHHADVIVLARQQAHQLILRSIRILILVDHEVTDAAVISLPRGGVVFEQAHGFEQEVVEVQRIGRPQTALELLEDRGHARHLRIFGFVIKILRGLAGVLRLADDGHHGTVRHRLFVEAQLLAKPP